MKTFFFLFFLLLHHHNSNNYGVEYGGARIRREDRRNIIIIYNNQDKETKFQIRLVLPKHFTFSLPPSHLHLLTRFCLLTRNIAMAPLSMTNLLWEDMLKIRTVHKYFDGKLGCKGRVVDASKNGYWVKWDDAPNDKPQKVEAKNLYIDLTAEYIDRFLAQKQKLAAAPSTSTTTSSTDKRKRAEVKEGKREEAEQEILEGKVEKAAQEIKTPTQSPTKKSARQSDTPSPNTKSPETSVTTVVKPSTTNSTVTKRKGVPLSKNTGDTPTKKSPNNNGTPTKEAPKGKP